MSANPATNRLGQSFQSTNTYLHMLLTCHVVYMHTYHVDYKVHPGDRKRGYIKCFDLIDCTMVLCISTCKFDAKTIPDAIKHVRNLF